MIRWKRTLRWALCAALAATPLLADEHVEMEAAADAAPPSAPVADDAGAAPDAAEPAAEPAAEADAGGAQPMPEPAQAMEPVEPETPALGAVAYDSDGRRGRIHVVAVGDTLWDISDLYLGTPWVWPSIWTENEDIANPHLIYPGDHIWITPGEMRRLTPEEAEAMLANLPAAPSEVPAAPAPEPMLDETLAVAPEEARMVRIAARETVGLISPELYRSAASIVARVPERILLSQEDGVYIGLGENEVELGDEFTVVRTNERVVDPDTGELLGYHVDLIGWVKVEEPGPESSLATIRMSTGEIEVGDRIIPRDPLPPEIAVQATPGAVEGKISFFPQKRVLMGFGDFVYLNRGELDGLEVGSPLEVYRPGRAALERARDEWIGVPDRVVAKMLVVRTEAESAVALVTSTAHELELGDRFRGATE